MDIHTIVEQADKRTNSLNYMKGVDQKHSCLKIIVHKVSNIIRRHIDNMKFNILLTVHHAMILGNCPT